MKKKTLPPLKKREKFIRPKKASTIGPHPHKSNKRAENIAAAEKLGRESKTRKAGDAKSTSNLTQPDVSAVVAQCSPGKKSSAATPTPIRVEAEEVSEVMFSPPSIDNPPQEAARILTAPHSSPEVIKSRIEVIPSKRRKGKVSEAIQQKLDEGGANLIAHRMFEIALDAPKDSDAIAAAQFITESTEGKKTSGDQQISPEAIDMLNKIAAKLNAIPDHRAKQLEQSSERRHTVRKEEQL